MARLLRPVTKIISVMPAAMASSTAYWISGLSTMGSISFGLALVAGRKRVPRPATGNTALVTFSISQYLAKKIEIRNLCRQTRELHLQLRECVFKFCETLALLLDDGFGRTRDKTFVAEFGLRFRDLARQAGHF